MADTFPCLVLAGPGEEVGEGEVGETLEALREDGHEGVEEEEGPAPGGSRRGGGSGRRGKAGHGGMVWVDDVMEHLLTCHLYVPTPVLVTFIHITPYISMRLIECASSLPLSKGFVGLGLWGNYRRGENMMV